MKRISSVLAVTFISTVLFTSCTQRTDKDISKLDVLATQIRLPGADTVFKSAGLTGHTVIIREKNDKAGLVLGNLGDKPKHLPASTFKIAHTLFGLQAGVITEDHVFKWDGEPRGMSIWEADLTLPEAFRRSCVPCYQEVAQAIGVERMNNYLSLYNYGEGIVTEDNLTTFWLVGDFKTDHFNQLLFLLNLYKNNLPAKDKNQAIVRKILVEESTEDYTLSSKTGLSLDEVAPVGWYVGRYVTPTDSLFFATSLIPNDSTSINQVGRLRKVVTMANLEWALGKEIAGESNWLDQVLEIRSESQ